MIRLKRWIPIGLTAVFLAVCLAIAIYLLRFIPSFPEILFGQIVLSRDSAPLPPKAYQSPEFVLGMVDEDQIKSAHYIHLQDEVLFWDPYYPGFPRTELSLEEVRQIQEVLSGGEIFKVGSGAEGISCLEISPGKELEWELCPAGGGVYGQFNDYRFQAYRKRSFGLLLIHLTGRKIVEIRIAPGKGGFAFEPYQKSGPWWIDGIVNQPFPLLEDLAARAEVEPIEVLWPRMSSDRANAKAHRILGESYQKALDAVHMAPEVREAFGDIVEIRPALGDNSYSSWMDSTCSTMTLYVLGTEAEGAVLLRGLDCFDLRMVVEGVPVPVSHEYICP
jgi:hypothetical protein